MAIRQAFYSDQRCVNEVARLIGVIWPLQAD
jgi:hypothetical protein